MGKIISVIISVCLVVVAAHTLMNLGADTGAENEQFSKPPAQVTPPVSEAIPSVPEAFQPVDPVPQEHGPAVQDHVVAEEAVEVTPEIAPMPHEPAEDIVAEPPPSDDGIPALDTADPQQRQYTKEEEREVTEDTAELFSNLDLLFQN